MSKPSPVEASEVLAVIPRGEHGEVRVRRVRLVTGLELLDVRLWRRTWRGHEPGKGVAIRLDEASAVAEALQKGAQK
jgi:hypothetical protein